MKRSPFKEKKGIAIFIAVIAVSAVLLIVLSISDIAFKEQILTYSGKDSKVAFYAADSGLECAFYHDIKKSGFYFATSSAGTIGGPLNCSGDVITPTSVFNAPTATSTFSFNLTQVGTAKACAIVIVSKTSTLTQEGIQTITKIESRGYNNTCDTSSNMVDRATRNLERSLEVRY